LIYDEDKKNEQQGKNEGLNGEEEWSSLEEGDICCGPGSYYFHDPKITDRHEGITTLEEAKRFVEEENNSSEGRNNPIVIWQLCHRSASDAAYHLVSHRQKFLNQNLDASTGKTAGDFCQEVSDYGKGNRLGSPMFFKPNAKKMANDEVLEPTTSRCLSGTDCPYYEDGHCHCTVERDGQGKIVALLGPWGERYYKVDKSSSNEKPNQDAASTQMIPKAVTVRAMKQQQMKIVFRREKAEKMECNKKEVQKKHALQELRDAMSSDSNATSNDAAQQVLQMQTFTNHLATIAENIHKIGSLNEILVQQDKKAQLDNLTNQLFDNMLDLAKQSPFVNDVDEERQEEEDDDDIENINGVNEEEDAKSDEVGEDSTGNSVGSSSSMDDFVEIN